MEGPYGMQGTHIGGKKLQFGPANYQSQTKNGGYCFIQGFPPKSWGQIYRLSRQLLACLNQIHSCADIFTTKFRKNSHEIGHHQAARNTCGTLVSLFAL
jgi:hypothetical protein